MLVTDWGMVTDVSRGQSRNALSPILVVPSDITTVVSFERSLNVAPEALKAGIVVSVPGIVIDVTAGGTARSVVFALL